MCAYTKAIHTADLEVILVTRNYLIGERLTFADITSTSVIFLPSRTPLASQLRAVYPKIHLCFEQPAPAEALEKQKTQESRKSR